MHRILFLMMTIPLLAGCPIQQRQVPMGVSNDWDYLEPQPSIGLVAVADPLIADVPEPVGFPAIASESISSVTGGGRLVHYVYQGRTSLADVSLFYRQQLTLHGWSNIVVSPDSENHMTLTADKPAEQLTIRVKDSNSLVTLTVDITPHYR